EIKSAPLEFGKPFPLKKSSRLPLGCQHFLDGPKWFTKRQGLAERTARSGQRGANSEEQTARSGQRGADSEERTARSGQRGANSGAWRGKLYLTCRSQVILWLWGICTRERTGPAFRLIHHFVKLTTDMIALVQKADFRALDDVLAAEGKLNPYGCLSCLTVSV